jgi:hypothetical protein
VVEGTGFENRHPPKTDREFKSHRLRSGLFFVVAGKALTGLSPIPSAMTRENT